MPDYAAIAAIAASRADKRNNLAEQRARHVAKHNTAPSTRELDARNLRIATATSDAELFQALMQRRGDYTTNPNGPRFNGSTKR